jgi:hypothetical protein
MCNLAKICTVLAACLAVTGTASAIDPLLPFVKISVPQTPLRLGEVWGPDLNQVAGRVTARVVANCPYHLEASFQGLRHEKGRVAIAPKDMRVAINGRELAVGSGRVPIATSQTPTPYGGVDVPIELQVGIRGLASYPAGRYGGTLVITVTAGS